MCSTNISTCKKASAANFSIVSNADNVTSHTTGFAHHRILGGVLKRKEGRWVADAFWKWRHKAWLIVEKSRRKSIYEERNSNLIIRTWKVLANAIVRRCLAKWREMVRAQFGHELSSTRARVKELETLLSKLHTKHDSTKAMNGNLVKRTIKSEAKSVEYFKLQKYSRLTCALQKLNILIVSKRTLGLVFGGGSGNLVKELQNHPCSQAFRKWEIFRRASKFAETARKHGLCDNLAWKEKRVSSLDRQLQKTTKELEEKKWAIDVMAKQVVRGAEECAKLKLELEDCYLKLVDSVKNEVDLGEQVDRFKKMLEGQVEKVLVLEDTVRHSPSRMSPPRPPKPASTARRDVLSQSQNSLLNRLEEEAGEVMRG